MKKNKIKWSSINKLLEDLKPYETNPRDITKDGIKDLTTSLDKFGLAKPIVINTDNTIIGGHARVLVLKEQGETECNCYIPNRKLTKAEVKELNVRLNKNIAGRWDFDILANNYEFDELLNWGFNDGELIGFEPTSSKVIEEFINPIYKVHILISVSTDDYKKILPELEAIQKKKFVEYEQSGN